MLPFWLFSYKVIFKICSTVWLWSIQRSLLLFSHRLSQRMSSITLTYRFLFVWFGVSFWFRTKASTSLCSWFQLNLPEGLKEAIFRSFNLFPCKFTVFFQRSLPFLPIHSNHRFSSHESFHDIKILMINGVLSLLLCKNGRRQSPFSFSFGLFLLSIRWILINFNQLFSNFVVCEIELVSV